MRNTTATATKRNMLENITDTAMKRNIIMRKNTITIMGKVITIMSTAI